MWRWLFHLSKTFPTELCNSVLLWLFECDFSGNLALRASSASYIFHFSFFVKADPAAHVWSGSDCLSHLTLKNLSKNNTLVVVWYQIFPIVPNNKKQYFHLQSPFAFDEAVAHIWSCMKVFGTLRERASRIQCIVWMLFQIKKQFNNQTEHVIFW